MIRTTKPAFTGKERWHLKKLWSSSLSTSPSEAFMRYICSSVRMFLPEIIDNTLAGCRTFDELMWVCLVRYYKQYFGQTAVNRIFRDDDGRILQLLTGAQNEYLGKNVGYTEIFWGSLLESLILTMRRVLRGEEPSDPKTPQNTIVLEAVQYLDTNYRAKALPGDFCQQYRYSLQYVSRRFKQETGFTASEYLQKKRLEKAASCSLAAICPYRRSPGKWAMRMPGFSIRFFRKIKNVSQRVPENVF